MKPEDPVYFLLKEPSLLSANDASFMLGRIVKNYAQPLSDYTPDYASSFNPRPLNSTPLSNVARIVSAANSSVLESKPLTLASLDKMNADSTKQGVLSSEIRALGLQSQGDVFWCLIRDADVRKNSRRMGTSRRRPSLHDHRCADMAGSHAGPQLHF